MSSDEHLTENNDSDNDPDNPIQEGGWKWKRPLMRGVSYTIVTYTKDSTIMNGIRRVLSDIGGEVALKQFEKSCFGRFLKLPDSINKCNQAIHHVISHQIIFGEEADKTALWFRINNQNLRFNRFEYALVTGLQFGESAFNPYVEHEIHEHSLYHRELDGRPTTPTELLKKFLEGHLGDYAEDYVKAAKILFAYYIVLGDDGRRAIKDWVWALIEDTEAWNSFPWGSYSFQRLIFYIDGVQQTPTKDCVREQYHLYGAASSFLAWIYCAIPELGKNCGGIASKSRIPRMLRFLYSRTVIDVDSITGTVYPILEPTDEEKNKKSWKSVESEGTPFKLKYMECRGMPKKSKMEVVSKKPVKSQKTTADCNPRSSNELVNPRVEETRRQAGPEDPRYSFTYSQRQAFVEEIGEYVVQKLMGQQFAQQIGDYTVRQVMSQLPQYMDFMRHNASINNPEVQMGDKSNAREVRENVGVSAGHGTDGLVQSGNEKVAGDNEDQNSTPTGNAWISPCPMPSQLSSRWGTQYESYPYFAPTQFTQGETSQSSIPSKLDYKEVRRREPSAILRSPFRIDDKRGNDFAKYLRTGGKRNVGLQNDVDSSFFKCIKNKSTLLEDIHIDAYLVVLHAQPGLAKLNKVDERVTITSTSFMAATTQAWKKYHKTDCNEQLNPDVEEVIPVEDLYELSKYVTGDLPGWDKYKPWYDYDELIMVCELESHWVTCSVNFIKSAITIYDSTQHKLDDTDYAVRKTFFTPLARMLPQILKYSGFYDERKEVKQKLTKWHFAYPESGNVYKQTDIKSGGAYALKYAEMILTKQHLPSFEKKDVEKFRVDVATTIYKFSTEG